MGGVRGGGAVLMAVALEVRVTGRVQGVWYRGWTQAEARRLGLRGWVRNEPDGSVTALLAGPEAAVAAMLEAMRQGPPDARVAGVQTQPAEDEGSPGSRSGGLDLPRAIRARRRRGRPSCRRGRSGPAGC